MVHQRYRYLGGNCSNEHVGIFELGDDLVMLDSDKFLFFVELVEEFLDIA